MATMAIPLAISGISALAGLLGNKKKTTQQTSTSTEDLSSSNMPQYDSQQQIMRSLLMNQFLGRTEDSNDYFGGYQRQGINNINTQSGLNDEAIQNILASRGLGRTSAGASSLISNQLNRGSNISGFMNSIPQMRDARNRQNMLDASSFFGQLPVGQSVTGHNTRTTTGTATDPGNPWGGAVGSLATTLGGLYGAGAFGGNKGTTYSGGGNVGSYPSLPNQAGGWNQPYTPEGFTNYSQNAVNNQGRDFGFSAPPVLGS
jgi:hypothetical protein